MPRRRGLRPRLLAPVLRSCATSVFAAERQVVSRTKSEAMSVGEIKNFVEVGAMIATGGQPSESQLTDVASAGYQVVINLGLLDPKYCLRDEAGLVAGLGMEYHHIPVVFADPEPRRFPGVSRTSWHPTAPTRSSSTAH